MGIKTKIAKYALLPGLRPRIAELFISGFQYVPYFIAVVYQTVRLLPPNHPYLNPANFGRYGVRHVIGEAANNLVISRKNIDQVILFFSIITGLVMFVIQFCLLGVSLVFQPVFAAGMGNIFITPAATRATDIAGMMLDMVFGVPGIFKSCVSTAALCTDLDGNPIAANSLPNASSPLADSASAYFPFAIHQGLHHMFQIYSTGLLVVGAFITFYFIITVLAETAESGTPFGKRFNKVWAPLRFVAAFGLLIPMNYGLNSAQYIVLYAAKFGSGFATNGWNLFNEELTGSYLGDVKNLVSRPNIPEIGNLLQFMYVSRVCYEGETAAGGTTGGKPNIVIAPYAVSGPIGAVTRLEITPGTDYKQIADFANGATTVTINFGELGDGKDNGHGGKHPYYPLDKGFVRPTCGQIKLALTDPRIPGAASKPEPGPQAIQQFYFEMIRDLWFNDAGTPATNDGQNYPLNAVIYDGNWPIQDAGGKDIDPGTVKLADNEFKEKLKAEYMTKAATEIDAAVKAQAESGSWALPSGLRRTGWAGAGIWYNRIAEMNGPVTTAVFHVPTPSLWPRVMEYVRKRKAQNDNEITTLDQFEPELAKKLNLPQERPEDAKLAEIYNSAYMYWQRDNNAAGPSTAQTGNIFIDAINLLLGTDGLFSMRRNTDVHPLAQLVGIGRSLVESSIRNMMGVGIATVLQPVIGPAGGAAASFFISIAMIGLTVGFILFYIVPFLPFIYFFFAIGGWFKCIFEAMLGAPLWALAHLRIDGNGFSGQDASQGYFLILEIFLRPILIVFGLLASISIFAAMVALLNDTFDLVISNMTGYDMSCEVTKCGPDKIEFYRGPIDQFFYTIVYAALVYIMGMSSFKLIDQIPQNILRWMGSSVQTFTEREDGAEGLVSTASVGTQQTLQNLQGGLGKLTSMGNVGK